ncbi:uveal autoantigen with coiled-coil domains and ankyrin repeats-like [Ochlerotatus camptorhynchus]|uniref:uveal autoantigen with coiled-coil domains and ankyrin repeats-like n=1 Tax=Ochlerotatus camptorhynchus TaxID=644619 RepID=UPI0031D48B5D
MSTGKNIWQAAATGDPIALQQCLQKKSSKNRLIKVGHFRDNHNWTLLHHTVASGNSECVELLLSKTDIDVKARCYEGRTALFLACMKEVQIEIAEMLLAKNATLVNVSNNEYITPLHIAVERRNLNLVELLVEHGANVNAPDFAGETPLHSALEFGHVEILVHLLYVGHADANVRSENDIDALEMLAARGNYDLKTKIACFKLLFNYMHRKQEYRQKYRMEDIYAVALLSYRSTSLIPYFVEIALLWEANLDKRRLARELLEGPRDQYQTSRFSDRVNRNLYHFLALLLSDDEGIRRLQDDFMNYEVIYSHSLIQNELVALSVAAIREDDNEKKLRMLLEYLDFVKHLVYFFSDHLAETLDMIKNVLMNDEADQNEAMTAVELYRYETVVNKIIEITSVEADTVLLTMTASVSDLHLQAKFFHPVVGFCTDVFMDERWLTAANLEKAMYSKLLHRHGTLRLVQSCHGYRFEEFTLLRQTRDVVRKAVLNAIDEDEKKRDLVFVARLNALEIPQNLIRYLRYL